MRLPAGTSIFFCMTGAMLRLTLLATLGSLALFTIPVFADRGESPPRESDIETFLSSTFVFVGKVEKIENDLSALHSEFLKLTVKPEKVFRGKPASTMTVRAIRPRQDDIESIYYDVGETVLCHLKGKNGEETNEFPRPMLLATRHIHDYAQITKGKPSDNLIRKRYEKILRPSILAQERDRKKAEKEAPKLCGVSTDTYSCIKNIGSSEKYKYDQNSRTIKRQEPK